MLRWFRKPTESTRLGVVHALSLFAKLRAGELRVVNGLLHERHYLDGEVVFDEGEEGQALYVVLAGRVGIYKHGSPTAGRIAEYREGSTFGELALLDGSPRSAQARAEGDCVLAALSRADFETLVETHAGIATKIAMQLARELGGKLRAHTEALEARPL